MQKTYRPTYETAIPGLLVGQGTPRVKAYQNNNGGSPEVWEIPLPTATATAASTQTVTINGVITTIKILVGDTVAQIAAKVINAIGQNPQAYGFVDVAFVAPDLVLTGRERVPLTISSTFGAATKTQSLSVEPKVIPFGRGVVQKSGMPAEACVLAEAGGRFLGFTTTVKTMEAIGIPMTTFGYRPFHLVDVVDRTAELWGMWVCAVEADLGFGDGSVYVSVSLDANQGKLTRVSSGGNLLVPGAAVKETRSERGENLALLAFNLP